MKREQMESFLKSIDTLESFGKDPEYILLCIKKSMRRIMKEPEFFMWYADDSLFPPAGNECGHHTMFFNPLICKCNLEEQDEST